MNYRDRAIYANQNLRVINRFEYVYLRKVFTVLHNQFKQYATELRLRGVDAVRSQVSKLAIDTRIGEVIKNMYATIGVYYAKKVLREVKRSAVVMEKAGQFNFSEDWLRQILDYFKMYLINKAVVPITIASKKQIMDILDRGHTEGWSIERMAKELEQPLTTMWRARLIVRTETAKAAYYGRKLGEKDSGYETQKEWISCHDFRTRHGHRDVDGTVIDEGQKFQVPVYKGSSIERIEMMNGPGDPEASAANVCNCRCTEAVTARRDANGRLIKKPPKSRISVIQPGNFVRPNQTITI
jgi:hypothetical protein